MNLKNYILEPDFKITILNNQIDILNYEEIEHFDIDKVEVKCALGLISIIGNNLYIKRLMQDEVLIVGNIKNIEFR